MSTPYGSYKGIARELIEVAAVNRVGGQVEVLVALHESTEVADFFDHDEARVARKRRKRVIDAMIVVLREYEDGHMEAPLRQSDTVDDVFVFAFADNAADDADRRVLLARLRCQPELRNELVAMDDRAFELLCGRLLELMGCDRVKVTRGTKDRGIDMLGRLPASTGVLPGARRMVLGSLNLVLVGQAKRYGSDSKVGPEEVRQIAGTWTLILLARANGELENHVGEAIDDLGVRAEDPPVPMIVTSSGFTRPAVQEARSGGVVLINGLQLAYALAREGVAIEDRGDGEWMVTADTVLAACVEEADDVVAAA